MEEVVRFVTDALALGAAASLKTAASEAVKDLYGKSKTYLTRTYPSVDLAPLEKKPESKAKQASVQEDLEEAGAGGDEELLTLARNLLEVVEKHDVKVAEAMGVDLEEVKARGLRVREVDSEGTGVKVKRSEFEGDIDIEGVRTGRRGRENPPKR